MNKREADRAAKRELKRQKREAEGDAWMRLNGIDPATVGPLHDFYPVITPIRGSLSRKKPA